MASGSMEEAWLEEASFASGCCPVFARTCDPTGTQRTVATVAAKTASLLVVLGESQIVFGSVWWAGEDSGAEWMEDLSNRLISFLSTSRIFRVKVQIYLNECSGECNVASSKSRAQTDGRSLALA